MMSHAEHERAVIQSMYAQVKKGEFLDFHLQRRIKTEFPGDKLLYAADKVLGALGAGPDSLLQGVSDVESREGSIRYYLCLLEVARSAIGTRVGIESDYRVIKGREYCGPITEERVTPQERPYVDGIKILAVWLKKYYT